MTGKCPKLSSVHVYVSSMDRMVACADRESATRLVLWDALNLRLRRAAALKRRAWCFNAPKRNSAGQLYDDTNGQYLPEGGSGGAAQQQRKPRAPLKPLVFKAYATPNDVKRRYSRFAEWMKAPNGQPTRLTEAQWCEARTDAFKKKYGDWEAVRKHQMLMDMPPLELKFEKNIQTVQEMLDAIKGLKVENEYSGLNIQFVNSLPRKIKSHGNDIKTFKASEHFGRLIKSAISAFEADEVQSEQKEGHLAHADHASIQDYKYFINKFTMDEGTYYVRFIARTQRSSNPKTQNTRNEIHDAVVTDVELYKENGAGGTHSGSVYPGETSELHKSDVRLQEWFDYVKKQDIKIALDVNGEPVFPIRDRTRL